MFRVRAVIAFILCVSLLLAASSASQSGKDEEVKVQGLSESEAVLFENKFDSAIANRAEEIRIWTAAIEAERIAAEQEAARRAQIEQERREAATRAAASQKSTEAGPAPSGDVWSRLAQCESGNRNVNTGNGYYGYFQFSAATWHSVGGTGLPSDHDYAEQLHRAQILQARSGWGQWPACSRKLGLR